MRMEGKCPFKRCSSWASPDGLVVEFLHAPLWRPGFRFLGMEPCHWSVSVHAVAGAHIEELEGISTRIYSHALGL